MTTNPERGKNGCTTMALNPDRVHVGNVTEKATIRVGSETYEVDVTAPFEESCNRIATELGIAGSFVISSGGSLMGKDLPADFSEHREVELLKYDAGGF